MEEFHVIGAGGIGLAIATSLYKAGKKVLLIENNPEKIAFCKAHGAMVDKQSFPINIEAFKDWSPCPNVVNILCVKCYNNDEILKKTNDQSLLFPIQNGFDELLTSRPLIGEGIASFISECAPKKTITNITRIGKLHLGPIQPWTNMPLLFELKSALRQGGIDSHLVAWSLPYKNTKLMYNAAISPLTSAGGLENAALLKPGKLRTLFFQFLLENHAILKASNQPMGTIGPFHPDKVAWLLNHKWLGESMAPFFRPSLKKTYCSMFHDVIGGATEIENYNGYLSRLAKTSKSPSPLNDIALNVIKQMASERSMGNAHWLKALLDAF
ncbi:MAG: hypothetical protein RLZ61_2719 [Planctomycetota bacterium]